MRTWRKKTGLSQDELAARSQLACLENICRVAAVKVESQLRSLFEYELIVIGTVLKAPSVEFDYHLDRSLRARLPTMCSARLQE